ncbi:MAG: flagellin, partial [Candidatus Puniceispirillales bacterium]
AAVGFTAGTYTGFLDVKNLDGTGVRVEAGSVANGYTGGTGTIDDVKAFGLNESSVAGVVESDAVSGTALVANEVKINDVLIGESTSGSAAHIATAINAKTVDHGVTATASNSVELTFDFQAAQPTLRTSFKINGSSVDLSAANDASEVVTAVNNSNIGDLRAASNADGTVSITSASGVDIVVANSDNDFLTAAKDVQGNSIFTGFGNGVYDLDGLLANTAPAAVADVSLDTSGSSLIGEVVNSRVVVTQHTTTNDGTNAAVVVTGTNSAGAIITESIDLTDGATVNLQIQGTTVFHTVTGLHMSGTPDNNAISVGFNGRAASTGTQGFDDNSLFASTSATAAGALTLSGDKVSGTSSVNLHGAVVTITGNAGNYLSTDAVNFTVVGTDAFGSTVSEVIALNNNHGEVHGSTAFHTITSITTDKVLQAAGASIGTYQVGDRIEAKGMLSLSNDNNSPIKIEAVGKDHTTLITENGATNTILDKLGLQNQSQSFEVSSQGVAVKTINDATSSLAKIDKAMDQLSLFRSSFGAVENRIDASINNLTTLKVNTEAAKARIQDADFAAETSKMTKSQILSQAATSMLAQANASKQNLLALLQG